MVPLVQTKQKAKVDKAKKLWGKLEKRISRMMVMGEPEERSIWSWKLKEKLESIEARLVCLRSQYTSGCQTLFLGREHIDQDPSGDEVSLFAREVG